MKVIRLAVADKPNKDDVSALQASQVDQERRFIEEQFDAALRACMTEEYRRQRVISERREDYIIVKITTTFKIPTPPAKKF